MAENLTRWQWARKHTEFTWFSEISGILVGAGIGLLVSQFLDVSAEIAGLIGACGAALLVPTGRLLANLARAGGIQQQERISDLETETGTLRSQLQAIQASQPSVQISIRQEGDNHFLVVKNNGGNGKFRAQIEITNKQAFPGAIVGNVFEGLWMSAMRPISDILNGLQDRVHLATVRQDRSPVPFTHVGLQFFDHMTTRGWLMASWPLMSDPPLEQPALWLRVTISSEPAMREPVVGGYVLSVLGLNDVGPDAV